MDTQTNEQQPVAGSITELINLGLAKYDEVIPAVEELKKELLVLTVQSGVEEKNGKITPLDKDGYKKITEAIKLVVSKRTAVEKKRVELKADSLAYGKAVDARAKEITAMLEPIESYLKTQKDAIDAEIKAKEMEIEERKNRMIRERHDRLLKSNMSLVGNEYIWTSRVNQLDQETILAINLELFDDEDFETFASGLEKKNQDDLKESERQKEEARLAEMKRDEEAKKLREEQDKLEKERQAFLTQRREMRNSYLADLGLTPTSTGWSLSNPFLPHVKQQMITAHQIETYSGQEWDDHIADLKNKMQDLIATWNEEENQREANRQQAIQEEARRLKEKQEEEERLRQEREQERLDGLSDEEKFNAYLDNLIQLPRPTNMKTKKWAEKVEQIQKHLKSSKTKE